ncbi:MAG: uracil-DNA glycosylase family protein [Gemmatimonadaceae bacterium]
MDGREQLKRFLEQRREAGERELVLDALSVDEVMRLVGAGHPGGTTPSLPLSAKTMAPGVGQPPHPPGTSGAGDASADWRKVLRSSGASPDRDTERPEEPQTESSKPAPTDAAPPGLVVGSADRELFGPMAALDSIDAVARSVASCTRCPLYATATNPVPGSGNPSAGLMVVGEAPGATEDEQGKPFVGAAGKLLTKILASVNLDRDNDVFICNVLKHRPPGNRNPLPDEISACQPYLVRQIDLIRPKAILALGTFAAQTLLQTKLAIGKLRSQVHQYHGVPLIVTYHPAALLRNPSWKRPTWEDVQLVRRILDSSIAQP